MGFFARNSDDNQKSPCNDTSQTRPWSQNPNSFIRNDDQETLHLSIGNLKTENVLLNLVLNTGKDLGKTILLKSEQGILTIDKPPDFVAGSGGSIRVYFQDSRNGWSFFVSSVIKENIYSLAISYPEALYHQQRRRHERIKTPSGTKAFFSKEDETLYGGMVKDISVAGMLVCSGKSETELDSQTLFSKIAIMLPDYSATSGATHEADERLIICEGKIVRSFRDHRTNNICHGVAFEEDNSELQHTLEKISSSLDTSHENI